MGAPVTDTFLIIIIGRIPPKVANFLGFFTFLVNGQQSMVNGRYSA